MTVRTYISPYDIYLAAALNAYIQQGHGMGTAIDLAKEVASKLIDIDEEGDED